MRARTLAVVLLLAGCHDDGPGGGELPTLPMVSDFGGPRLAHPRLVPIFYSDDTDAMAMTRYSQWIVTSSWLTQVGAEYGVGAGSVLSVVTRPQSAPDTITEGQIIDLVFGGIGDASLPPPGPDVLYIVNFPPHTKVTGNSSTSCIEVGGYHQSARRNGVEIALAVIPTCPGFVQNFSNLEIRELVTSHEVIEAATNPFPVNHPAFQLRDPSGEWLGDGEEVADLCARSDATGTYREAGFLAVRSWSNAAAAAGDPCVPVPSSAPYYNVGIQGDTMPRIKPGERRTLTLTGWATGAMPDWLVQATSAKPSDGMVMLPMTRINSGTSVAFDVNVPATTQTGTTLRIFLFSGLSQTDYQLLPMIATVGEPCSTFTSCEACSAHIGCGFCAATGTCEEEHVAGSASCPGGVLAIWPGSCGAYCASHGPNCAQCASQPGCGWCSSSGGGQCLEASQEYSHPERESCPYADWSFTPDYCPP